MRQLLRLSMVAFAAVCLFVGCGRKYSERKDTDANGNKIISLYTMQLKPVFTDFTMGLINEFEKDNPGVKVNWIDQPADGFETKLMTLYSMGQSPDVINLNMSFLVNLNDRNLLLGLDDMITSSQRAMFVQTMLEQACSVKGRLVSVPWYVSVATVMYNKELFEKAGLDPNKVPRNTDELFEYCRLIKEKTGIFGELIPLAEDGVFKTMLLSDGVKLTNDDLSKATFNTTAAAEIVRKYKNAYDKEWIPRESVTGTHRRAIDMFKSEKAAMLINGPQFLRVVKAENPDLYKKVGVGFAPARIPDGTYGTETMSLGVSSQTRHPKESLALALWFCAPKNQLAFSKIVPVFPSTHEALNDPFFTDPGNTPDQMAIYIGAKQVAKGVLNAPVLANTGKLNRAMNDMIRQVFLQNSPVEESLDLCAERWTQLLNQKKRK